MKFYSEKLDKMFDTEKQLLEEEEAVFKAEQEVKAKSLEKKAEAKVVEAAFKKLNAAKRTYNTNVLELKKQFNQELTDFRAKLKEINKKHEEAMAAEAQLRDEAEAEYKAALDEFIAKHPEGYHMTLKDGDHVVTISGSSNESKDLVDQLFDPKSFWDEWMRIFRFQ